MFHSGLKAQDSQTGLHFYRRAKPHLKCDLLTFNVGHSKAFHGYKQNTEYVLTLGALVNSNIRTPLVWGSVWKALGFTVSLSPLRGHQPMFKGNQCFLDCYSIILLSSQRAGDGHWVKDSLRCLAKSWLNSSYYKWLAPPGWEHYLPRRETPYSWALSHVIKMLQDLQKRTEMRSFPWVPWFLGQTKLAWSQNMITYNS